MRRIDTESPGVFIIEPVVHGDHRGFFMESYHRDRFAELGIDCEFVQDNHSRSTRGVLRGLHYQLNQPQGKLVRVVTGEVYDVAVDIRRGSPHYRQWVGVVLSEENRLQLYIPPGFAHGFCTLSEQADFLYKCTDFYTPGDEYGIAWDDPDIGIDWPSMDYILSGKDRDLPRLAESRFLPGYHGD